MEEQNIKLTKLTKCAGCGAKVGAGVLAQLLEGIRVHHDPNLLVGFDKSDDASVYKISDELALVQTVDFFPPIADDPYLFGQIAATNALSDVYAMGGEPKLCLNIMAVPEDMPKEAVHDILRGGYDKVYEAGALITGGHSILDDEPKYGLCVTGYVHPDKALLLQLAQGGIDGLPADAGDAADLALQGLVALIAQDVKNILHTVRDAHLLGRLVVKGIDLAGQVVVSFGNFSAHHVLLV